MMLWLPLLGRRAPWSTTRATRSAAPCGFPAVVRRGGVQVAVSSGQELPLLAQALGERIAALLPESDTVAAWVARRERALTLDPAAREDALAGLRAEIRTALGLPALGGAA